ncbi:MAG: hypothetical protein M3458_23245 [Acidobacteriota bacterium]|nr:hypothetical protein [Acidobacteriota bacterium]
MAQSLFDAGIPLNTFASMAVWPYNGRRPGHIKSLAADRDNRCISLTGPVVAVATFKCCDRDTRGIDWSAGVAFGFAPMARNV